MISFGEFPDGIVPKRGVPRSPKYLAEVEWAWSPANNRIDAYYIQRTRKQWILWNRWLDDNCIPWQWHWQPVGVVSRKGIVEKQAAVHLLLEFWKSAASLDTDHFHWIDETGLLSVGELMAIGRAVWAPGRKESVEPVPEGSDAEGWAKPDDPIYQGGWNFIAGKNLNPRYVEKSIGKKPEQEQPEQEKPKD